VSKPHVILIFGNPDSGKSWLANRMSKSLGHDVLHVDDAYVYFVKEYYPKAYFDNLNMVVSQHYKTILKATNKGVDKAWANYLTSLVEDRLDETRFHIVEGYLLLPILKSIRYRLSRVAQVTVIYAQDRVYYTETDMPYG